MRAETKIIQAGIIMFQYAPFTEIIPKNGTKVIYYEIEINTEGSVIIIEKKKK